MSNASNFKVAIVGHSQVPDYIQNIPNCQVHIFKKPGAQIKDIYESPELSQSFSWGQDLTILFIGGNDFPVSDGHTVTSELLNLISEYQTTSKVAVFLIESREYKPNNRFRVTTDEYKQFQTYVNNRIKRQAPKRQFRTINTTRAVFETNRRDGIHFNTVGQSHIRTKICQCIERHMSDRSGN